MKMFKYIVAVAAVAACGLGFAESSMGEFDAGRNVTINDMGGDLRLSGEVGVEYVFISNQRNGESWYGGTTGRPSSQYDVDVKLNLDYNNDSSWAHVQFRSDNNLGLQSTTFDPDAETPGQTNSSTFQLREAFYGMKLFEDGASALTFEIGREQMNHVYDSSIQFDSRTKHDGMIFKYINSFESLGDLGVTASFFIINDVSHHYAWATQLELANIMDSGLYARYSYNDIEKKTNNIVVTGSASRTHEVNGGYNFNKEMLGIDAKIWAGYLVNSAAKKNAGVNNVTVVNVATGNKKENSAWYVGVKFGDVQHEGDWSLEARYENVNANSVLASDAAGIGRYGKLGANYKGYIVNAAYGITENLVGSLGYIDAKSKVDAYTGTNGTGGVGNTLDRFEMELTYSF